MSRDSIRMVQGTEGGSNRTYRRMQVLNAMLLDGQHRQLPIAGVQRTWSTLAGHSAVPRRTNVKRMNAKCAIQIAQPNERRVYEDQFLLFRWRHERQQTTAIRIVAITLASDFVVTTVATRATIYRSLRAQNHKTKKSQKESFWGGSGKKSPKIPKT